MMRDSIVLAGILALTIPAWSQASGQPPGQGDGQGDDATRASYTVYMQPPQIFEQVSGSKATITDCLQDSQGFIWLSLSSAAAGLSRWDGYSFRNYVKSVADPSKMQTGFVTSLATSRDNKLWIATGDAGVSVLNLKTDKFKHYRANVEDEKSLSSDGTNLAFVDSRDNVWIGTADGVLNLYQPDTDDFHHVRAFEELETEIKALIEGADGMIWIGTDTEGLFKYDPNKERIIDRYVSEDGMSSDAVTALALTDDGAVWVGTDNGLNRLDPKTNKFKSFYRARQDRTALADSTIRNLFTDRDGVLWVGTEGGVHELRPDGESFIQYSRDAKDPATTANFPRRTTCIMQDRGGVLYFADFTTGLFKATPSKRAFQPHVYASKLTEVTSLTNGGKGVVWGGTFGQGIVKFDFNKRQVTAYPILGDPSTDSAIRLREWILAVHRDKRGNIWLGGQGLGLIRFHPPSNTFRQFRYDEEQLDGPTSNDIQDILEGPDGSIWLATFGGGLNRFYPKTGAFMDFMTEPNEPTAISANHLYVLRLDRKDPNIMWIGTARGGLNRLNIKKEKFTRYSMAPEGTSTGFDTIMTIYQDGNGILWLGTDGNGVVRFDPQSQEKRYYSTTNGLSNDVIYGMLPGEGSDLWLSTNGGGLVRLSPDKPQGEQFDIFTRADGLFRETFNQNAYIRTINGKLIFIAGHGFHYFDPKAIEADQFAPTVAMTSFKLYNKEVPIAKPIWTTPEIQLDYDQDIVSFEFAGLSYAAPGYNRYKYKMDGLHGWIETNQRSASFTNLDGGDYTLRVKAANQHGVWSDAETVLKVHVDPPPWRTWWAYALYILALVGILLAYLRYQARKVDALRNAHRLETVENELALTGAVQTGFLPRSNSVSTQFFNLEGFYRPADRASGDWWWYEERGDKFILIIGDVTGHGPGPAMVTAAAATAFRIQARERDVNMEERLSVLNEEVLRVGAGAYQMTMSAIEIDGRTGRFVHHSAGGQPVMRLRGGAKPRLLPCPGTPLGTESFNLGRIEGTMSPGERLLIYTDGIPELALANGRLLGMRRFSMMCERTLDLPLQHSVAQIVEAADVLRNNRAQDDDWTFAMVEWKR